MGAVVARWGDGDERTATTGTVSVAELYRRLGAAPATADTAAPGATPLLVGDLLRREGHTVSCPEPDAPRGPSSVPASTQAPVPEIPVPRRRTADACRTALGAGGL